MILFPRFPCTFTSTIACCALPLTLALAHFDLKSGRLVRPFDRGLSTPLTFSYYLVCAKAGAEQPKIKAFRDWVLEEARLTREYSQ